ncbi:MAG: flagellar hook assembly protein FlgD [Gammaproteobacteria bacterium]|nr:flagellar hook assembly protein FlgD [Gammaproteobacteria bacterium]MBU1730955.1 flagellar hook assembly protein FlgD [Gammaproteobacteria bacterium]MBU1893615.1 flagellar hook assembly protein FlgD [Gammaproteobacteria bacterium]
MTTVNEISALTTTTATTKTASQESEDRFLKLLVTQMQNQDPLNPMDNAEITSQMAQLSTVTELGKLNDAASAMTASLLAGQSLQAASLVGHGVMIPGDKIELSGGVAYGGVDLTQAVDKLTVNIKDASGKVIHTSDLGPQDAAGSVPFQWDGTTDSGTVAPDGSYTFEVLAEQGGKAVAATALAVGQVGSVSLGVQGAMLNVIGLGPVAMSEVKEIL